MNKKSPIFIRFARNFLIVLLILSTLGSYQHRVLNTISDPSTEYKTTVLWSYFWGLVKKPQEFYVPNCTDSNALDEVVFSKRFGQSLLTVVTLGIVSPVEVKWKCHKPCQRISDDL